jgi:hypothetical protein
VCAITLSNNKVPKTILTTMPFCACQKQQERQPTNPIAIAIANFFGGTSPLLQLLPWLTD